MPYFSAFVLFNLCYYYLPIICETRSFVGFDFNGKLFYPFTHSSKCPRWVSSIHPYSSSHISGAAHQFVTLGHCDAFHVHEHSGLPHALYLANTYRIHSTSSKTN